MRKLIFFFLLVCIALLFSGCAEEKSYEVEQIHIKSWIQPNGDLLVNEVFTYKFTGDFTRLNREYPNNYNEKIENFYSYEIADLHVEPGFIDGDSLKQLEVNYTEDSFQTSIEKSNERASFLYVYTVKDAVASYTDFSELKVDYFGDNPAHEQDFHNVTIDFIFPETVNPEQIDGYLFDRESRDIEKNEYGIRFGIPVSSAYDTSKVSIYFPSILMTEQQKKQTGMTREEVMQENERQLHTMNTRLDYIPTLRTIIPYFSYGILIIAFLFIILLPQRQFWRRGAPEDTLGTDILYLYFVDRLGKPEGNSFLAGLFSLSERGLVNMHKAPPFSDFRDDYSSQRETIEFELLHSQTSYYSYEKKMVDWLFSLSRKFHLHEAAAMKNKKEDKEDFLTSHHKVVYFRTKKQEWEKEVNEALKEAGSFHEKLQATLLSIVIFLFMLLTSFAFYADLQSVWEIVLVIVFSLIYIGLIWFKGKSNKWFAAFTIIMLFVLGQIIDEQLLTVLFGLLFSIMLLSIALPKYILSSSAVRIKHAIRSFRRSLRNDREIEIYKEDVRWVNRAYLLKGKKKTLPIYTSTLPLAAFLLSEEDPFLAVEKTWTIRNGPDAEVVLYYEEVMKDNKDSLDSAIEGKN